jgi:hypothetical protein
VSEPEPDPVLARDLEIANLWMDTGIGMAQRAIRAFARGIEAGHRAIEKTPLSNPVDALNDVANLLEYLKHGPRRRSPGPLESGDGEADQGSGRPGDAD